MERIAASSPTPSISRDLQLEKRAQQSAGGEGRLNLSFRDLNCTGAHDTDGGHSNSPISPKRGRLRLSSLCQGCSAWSPYLEYMASFTNHPDSSSTSLVLQRGQSAHTATKRACLGPEVIIKPTLSPHSAAPSGTQRQMNSDLSKAAAQLVKALPGTYGALYSISNMTEIWTL